VGQILSFVYTEIRGMIVYVFEGREEELLIHMELFLQIHSEYADGEQPEEERLRQDAYWFISDYSDVMAAYRVREQVDPFPVFCKRHYHRSGFIRSALSLSVWRVHQ